jgi:hypothetical protein
MTVLPLASSFPLREKGTPPTGPVSGCGGVPGGGPAPGTAGPPPRPAPAAQTAPSEAAALNAVHNLRRDPSTGRMLLDGVPVCDGCGRPSETAYCPGARGHVCRVKRATEMRRIRERVVPLWSPGQRPIKPVVPPLHVVARKGWP